MIAIGSDHGGFGLKEEIKKYLEQNNIEYKDFGTYSSGSCDYADIAEVVCQSVLSGESKLGGILICGTGIGISMAANKIHGIRAALCSDSYSAKMTKMHNNANVICLGGRVIGAELAFSIIDAWMGEEFEGGRHAVRIGKIHTLEEK